MSVMNVDYDKLRIILLPHVLREGSLIEALFTAAYVPLKRLYGLLVRYEAGESRERAFGPTVKQLKAAIGYHLGIDPSLVQIGDVQNRDVLDLRKQSDMASTRLALGATALTLWSDDMVWWSRDFTVSLPASCRGSQPEVEAILDRWKMAASKYTITYR